MNTRRIVTAVLGLILGTVLMASSIHAQLSEAERLYESGIYQLEAVGNFNQAITIFGRVAKEFATNKPLAAKALLKLGLCYERLGSQKAEEAYQRVIREYPDQREVAAEARTRLAALAAAIEAGRGPIARRLLTYLDTDINDFNDMVPSPDGRRVAYTRLGTDGMLMVRDLVTGTKEQITPNNPDTFNQYPAWSPDGKQIAYGTRNDKDRTACVKIVDVASHKEVSSFKVGHSYPMEWSRDGRFLLLRRWAADRGAEASLLLLEINTGSTTVLADTIPVFSGASFSPDGRFVAYTARVAGSERVFTMPITGGKRQQVTDINGGSTPRWSPDGKAIAFTRSDGVYVIPVADGAASGTAQRVHESASAYLQSWTKSSGLFMTTFGGESLPYQIAVDPQTGKPANSKAQPLAEQLHDVGFFAWSPDMRQIAFASGWGKISIYSKERQTATQYDVKHPGIVWDLWWSADGREVIFEPDLRRWPGIVLALDPSTGNLRQPFPRIPGAGVTSLSANGRRIVYSRRSADSSGIELVVSEVGSSETVMVASVDTSAGWLSGWIRPRFSAKADQLLFGRQTGKTATLWVVSSDGTGTRNLGTMGLIWHAMWDPTGRFIAYSGTVSGKVAIRVVEVATGIEHDIPLPVKDPEEVRVRDWSPDGKYIGVTADEARWEYWVLQGVQENVR
jgi:Tol biopolymer transport system component